MPSEAFTHEAIEEQEGIALNRSSMCALYSGSSQLFDGKLENLTSFLTKFKERISEAKWQEILNVSTALGMENPELHPFTSSHGNLNLCHLTQLTVSTMNVNHSVVHNNALAAGIMATLTPDFAAHINTYNADFTIGDCIAAICLLKVRTTTAATPNLQAASSMPSAT
jgi:hypothetical protein